MRTRLLSLICFFCLSALISAAPATLGLWARGNISLYDQEGKVSTGPSWVGQGAYNELGLSWAGTSSGWSALAMYGADGGPSAFLDSFRYYFRFLDKKLKLSFGKPRIDDYRISSYIDDIGYGSRIFTGEHGFLLQAYPAPGLSLAGGFQVPLETMNAADVYDNFRLAASYSIDKVGVFNAGYLNDIDRQAFFSTALHFLDPVRLLLGYKGYFDGSGVQYAYGSAKASAGSLNFYLDLLGRFSSDFRYEVTTLVSYSRPAFTVGSSLWWVSQTLKIGCTPYVSAKVPNGFVRLGYRWAYAFDGDLPTWSVPLTYELSF
ncbi:MAG: hypothetical protein WCT14_09260 [Treponemataceae bacterium]